MSFTAKSIILDIHSNWGSASYLGVRSVDLWFGGSKIAVTIGTFVAYNTSELSFTYNAADVFNTTKSKTGSSADGWLTTATSSQRIICVFNSPKTFDEIRINNYHNYGGDTDAGIRNVTITISSDTIISTVYNEAISNSMVVFTGDFDEHVAANTEDEQIITPTIPMPVIVGAGGAIAGGTSPSHYSSLVYASIGGALGGGAGLIVSRNVSLTYAGTGGAIAGGDGEVIALYNVTGELIPELVELNGVADTANWLFGNVVPRLPVINGVSVTGAICEGRLFPPKIKINADTGETGKINVFLPNINASATTPINCLGNVIPKKPSMTGNILSWNTAKGNVICKIPTISGVVIQDVYVTGALKTPKVFLQGIASNYAMAIGNVTPRLPKVYGQTSISLSSDIIKY